jgi:hypothetical protein
MKSDPPISPSKGKARGIRFLCAAPRLPRLTFVHQIETICTASIRHLIPHPSEAAHCHLDEGERGLVIEAIGETIPRSTNGG